MTGEEIEQAFMELMASSESIGKLLLEEEKKKTDIPGRACLLEADGVKLVIVYIYWGLKKHYACW